MLTSPDVGFHTHSGLHKPPGDKQMPKPTAPKFASSPYLGRPPVPIVSKINSHGDASTNPMSAMSPIHPSLVPWHLGPWNALKCCAKLPVKSGRGMKQQHHHLPLVAPGAPLGAPVLVVVSNGNTSWVGEFTGTMLRRWRVGFGIKKIGICTKQAEHLTDCSLVEADD